MSALLVRGGAKQDVKMLKELAERLGVEITELTEREKEDLGLAHAIKQGRRTPVVSKASVVGALKRARSSSSGGAFCET